MAALIAVQLCITAFTVHRESLTFDEEDHMYAGYMMWHAHDYGLNPEHPPLVKLLATIPLLGRNLWIPPSHDRDFKVEAYLNGRDWLARNDGDRNQMVFQMRMAADLIAVALSLVVYFATREYFGSWAALVAVVLAVFDPTVLAHSALVTTDIGVSLFFLASTWCFYRYVKRPSLLRLIVAGVVAGLLLATKHSGVLLAPMLLLLICYEVIAAGRRDRLHLAIRLAGAFCFIVVIGVLVLWCFYGFRYSARPPGLKMSTTLADYVAPLGPHIGAIINGIGKLHLLPESYLIGLVDVERAASFYPTFVFNTNYAHGVWWYFPSVLLIKSTLGLLALCALGVFALVTRKFKWRREIAYLAIPALVYFAVAMVSNMNIGARHLLPFYTFLFVFAGGAVAALAQLSSRWRVVCVAALAAHVLSSLLAFPHSMAYANEAFGGVKNVHNLLSDANVDWGQQLYQVKQWQKQHPKEECWLAYFAYPEILPETYGIHCHHLPTMDTMWVGGAENVPSVLEGTVLISAGDLSGCEWPAASLNPFDRFRSRTPDEVIDQAVFVYRGRFDLRRAAALARAQNALLLVSAGQATNALSLAEEAVRMDPTGISAHQALGDALEATGRLPEARKEWRVALGLNRQLSSGAQALYGPDLEARSKR
jgi:4-amino-4-deoxy-L-arabinose transferase-like glycosyltransferase